jgi:hypothetical protein
MFEAQREKSSRAQGFCEKFVAARQPNEAAKICAQGLAGASPQQVCALIGGTPAGCRGRMEFLFGRAVPSRCAPDDDECLTVAAFRKAQAAGDVTLCGLDPVCQQLMGKGAESCEAYAAAERERACAFVTRKPGPPESEGKVRRQREASAAAGEKARLAAETTLKGPAIAAAGGSAATTAEEVIIAKKRALYSACETRRVRLVAALDEAFALLEGIPYGTEGREDRLEVYDSLRKAYLSDMAAASRKR